MPYGTFQWTFSNNIICGNVDKSYRCFLEENKSNETIRRLLINIVVTLMSIDEMPIDIWFLSIV